MLCMRSISISVHEQTLHRKAALMNFNHASQYKVLTKTAVNKSTTFVPMNYNNYLVLKFNAFGHTE
jgi:hypothetical protein